MNELKMNRNSIHLEALSVQKKATFSNNLFTLSHPEAESKNENLLFHIILISI